MSIYTNYQTNSMISKGENGDFQGGNIEKNVSELRNSVLKDIKNGRAVKDFFVINKLKISQKELNSLCGQIIDKYDIELKIPASKILKLAGFKDDLDYKLENYKKEHLLILLYSMTDKKKIKTDPKTSKEPTIEELSGQMTKKSMDIAIPYKLTVKGKEITFLLPISMHGKEDVKKKLNEIADTIITLTGQVKLPIPWVKITREFSCFTKTTTDRVVIGLDYHKTNTVHEIGHYIFKNHILKDDEMSFVLGMLYVHSLGGKRYEAFDESNYVVADDTYGHPFDNVNEFFASAFSSYFLHKDNLNKIFNDPETLADHKSMRLISAVYQFMQEFIMHSSGAIITDKFGNEKKLGVMDLSGNLFTTKSIRESLDEAIKDDDPRVRKVAKELSKVLIDE